MRRRPARRARDGADIGAGGQFAENAAARRQPAAHEGVRDGGRRVLDQQRRLPQPGQPGGDAAGLDLGLRRVGQAGAPLRQRGVVVAVLAGGRVQLARQRGHASGSRCSARSTSSAMTLPEPSQTEFTGVSRYSLGMGPSST